MMSLKRKAQKELDDGPEIKRRRMSGDNHDQIPMQITDLNFDCLDKAFETLNIQDLLHLADSNDWLKVVAQSLFRRKFAKVNFNFFLNCNQNYLCIKNVYLFLLFF